jgi:hypothetical protein
MIGGRWQAAQPPTDGRPAGKLAEMGKLRRKSFTSFLEDIVDDSKDFIDDLTDRARTVEHHAHDAVHDAAADERGTAPDSDGERELAELRESLADLTLKVNRMAKAYGKGGGRV